MYITRRTFKNNGVYFVVGSEITDPTTIKRFRSKLADRIIVEVNEHNFDKYHEYFLGKFGIDISQPLSPLDTTEQSLAEKLVEEKEPDEEKQIEEPAKEEKPVEDKPIIKAVPAKATIKVATVKLK